MRVLLLTVQAPFVRGGAEHLVESLEAKIAARGHQTEVIRLPFKWYPATTLLQHLLAYRLLKIYNDDPSTLAIGLKYPAYTVPFPRKRLWLLHQFRQAYDLWGTPYQDLPDTPEGRRVSDMIVASDTRHLQEAEAIYTISHMVAERLWTYNQIKATAVLHHPLGQPELLYPGPAGDYFLYPSRLTPGKRQHLAIEALRHTRSAVSLVLTGRAESAAHERTLRQQIEAADLQQRVRWLGWITDEEKARLYANACGVIYIPYDEDSYGYVTLEAFHAHKPVLTFQDSGGTHELVEHERNGLILEPSPQALAAAMDDLWANRRRAQALGEAAFDSLKQHKISWDHVLDTLLQ